MKKIVHLIFFFCTYPLFSQSPLLQHYVEEGIAANLSLKQQHLEIEKALRGIEIAKTHFFPQITFAPTYSVAFGGRKIQIPIGDLLNPVYQTLNHLTDSNAFPMVENASEQLAPMNFHDTKLEIKAPLFNSDIRNNVRLQRDLLVTEQAKKTFLEFELRYAIEAAYFQFLQANEAVNIYAQAVQLAEEHMEFTQNLSKQGEVLQDAVLTTEHEVSQLRQEQAEAVKNARVAKAYFNFLLNRNLEEPVLADTLLFSQLPPLLSLKAYTQNALGHRPELTQLQSGLQSTQTLQRMQEQSALFPQMYVGANAGFQGFGYTFRNQAYTVGQVGLNWPIYHAGEKKLKIQQTKIAAEILHTKVEEAKKQIEMDVFQKYADLETVISALENKALDVNRTLKILHLVQSKFKHGEAIALELSKARSDYQLALLAKSLAQKAAWIKYAELKKASAY